MAKVVTTPLRDHKLYFVVYKIVCYLVFRTFGPLVALLVLNVIPGCSFTTRSGMEPRSISYHELDPYRSDCSATTR